MIGFLHAAVVFGLTISRNCLQSIDVPLAFAGLAAHSWQIEVLSMATTVQDKLTPVSVAVTNQMIGLFIQALCVLHVTMHRQAKVLNGPFDRRDDRVPGCPVSPGVTESGPPQTLRQILF